MAYAGATTAVQRRPPAAAPAQRGPASRRCADHHRWPRPRRGPRRLPFGSMQCAHTQPAPCVCLACVSDRDHDGCARASHFPAVPLARAPHALAAPCCPAWRCHAAGRLRWRTISRLAHDPIHRQRQPQRASGTSRAAPVAAGRPTLHAHSKVRERHGICWRGCSPRRVGSEPSKRGLRAAAPQWP